MLSPGEDLSLVHPSGWGFLQPQSSRAVISSAPALEVSCSVLKVAAALNLDMTEQSASSQDSKPKKTCAGKQKAMLAYGVIQISATVVSAISLAAIAFGLCAVKQESKAFNGCVEEVIAAGRTNAQAVRFCNGGRLPKGK